jgi:predicted dehydrogenase
VEEGRALITKCHEKGRWVQVGHQRRYNPKYSLGMWMAHESDLIGRITHITAQWHRNQQWRRPVPKEYVLNEEEKKHITDLEKHLNWRLYNDLSGGLFTELATHQTDVANWFLKAMPARVTAMAGLDYWRDGRTAADNIGILYEYDLKRSLPGFHTMKPRTTLMDETSANRNYTVRFQYSSILSCEKRGCTELVQGDYGSMELTEHTCRYFPEPWVVAEEKAKKAAKEAGGGKELTAEELAKQTISGDTRKDFSDKAASEGIEMLKDIALKSPDTYQFEAFVNCIRNGGVPLNNEMVGYTTAITALAAMQAAREQRVVQIDPAWYSFDFETPSFYDYDASWGRNNKQQTAAPPPAPEGEAKPAVAG